MQTAPGRQLTRHHVLDFFHLSSISQFVSELVSKSDPPNSVKALFEDQLKPFAGQCRSQHYELDGMAEHPVHRLEVEDPTETHPHKI